jgi:hypothetical protein
MLRCLLEVFWGYLWSGFWAEAAANMDMKPHLIGGLARENLVEHEVDKVFIFN